jgi:hypothetical protein
MAQPAFGKTKKQGVADQEFRSCRSQELQNRTTILPGCRSELPFQIDSTPADLPRLTPATPELLQLLKELLHRYA